MKKKICFLLVCGWFAASANIPAHAEDLKSGFLERKDVIEIPKSKGIVGENSRGYLEFISPEKEKEEVIQEENSARRKVYEKIGKKTGADPEIVGRRRARQIAERARRGYYIQDEDGKWHRK